MKSYDIVVVGLGAVGSAALYQLSKRGVQVLGIDQYDPPHTFGSSHGETRITRVAVGESKDYVKLVARSHELWREIEEKSGDTLFTNCKGILMDSGRGPWSKYGSEGFLEKTIALAREFHIPHEVLFQKELRDQFPQFQLESSWKAYLEKGAGFLRPELCISTQLELAKNYGAEVMLNTAVQSLDSSLEEGIILQLENESIFAKRVLLSAGGWLKDFLPKQEKSDYKICRQVLHWVKITENHAAWQDSPVYMWGFGPNPEDFIYGFPSLDGESVKMASESFLSTDHPELLNREVTSQEQRQFIAEKIKGRFSGLSNEILKSSVCFYTVTSDARFVIKPLTNHPKALMISACSGHGFKHSAALGEYLAEKLLGIKPKVEMGLI